MAGRGRKRAQRGGGGGLQGGGGRGQASVESQRTPRPSSLPAQYDFVPRESTQPPPLVTNNQPPPSHRDYPPPRTLFQNSTPQPGGTTSPQEPPVTSPRPRTSAHSSQAQNSPRSHPHSSEHHSSQAHDSHRRSAEYPEAPFEEEIPIQPSLSDDQLNVLNSLLTQPGRDLYTTVLSPTPRPGTTWYATCSSYSWTILFLYVFRFLCVSGYIFIA